jgi:hypothetical protein
MALDKSHNNVPREVGTKHRKEVCFLHFQPSAQGYVKGQNRSYPLIISVSCRYEVRWILSIAGIEQISAGD